MGKKASCNILISYSDMRTSGGRSTMADDLWEHLLSSPIKVITYCTFPLTFPLSQCNLCSPNQPYPYVCTPLWLSRSFFMEVSKFAMHLSSLMQWPTSSSSKAMERYLSDLQVKSNQIQVKALLTPPLMSHFHLWGTFKTRRLPWVQARG